MKLRVYFMTSIRPIALSLFLLVSSGVLAEALPVWTHAGSARSGPHALTSLTDLFGITATAVNGTVTKVSDYSTDNGDTSFTITTDDGRTIVVNVVGWPTSNPNGSTRIHLRDSRDLSGLEGKTVRIVGKMKDNTNQMDAKEIWELP